MSTEKAFRTIVFFFLIFFILFGFFLFPYQELLHPNPKIIDGYIRIYPHFRWFFIMWSKWTLILFYIIGELWPMIIFTLLYWQLANKITKTEESSRFYFLINLFGQSNLLICGSIIMYFSRNDHCLSFFLGEYKTRIALKIASLVVVVILLCIFILLLHTYIEKYIMRRQTMQVITRQQEKLQLSLWDSFKIIVKSKYLGLICILMISYSMVIGLVEGLWLHEVSLFYKKNSVSFITYQGKVLFWTGITTLLCSFLGNTVIRKLGWLGTALATPVMALIMGSCFFILVIVSYYNLFSKILIGIPFLSIIVAIGSMQNVLIKGVKYCFFDITKEMAYIPLDNEMRTKGKAAVDILGGKIGKASGAILQVACYTIFSSATPDQLAPFLMIMFGLICVIWIKAVTVLSQEYYKLILLQK